MEGEVFTGTVRDLRELADMPPEYREAVVKITVSHAVNEIAGAEVFDEPAIKLAPTPYCKWLACRIAMEEYGHHVYFSRLASQLGVPAERLDHRKKHLSVFDLPISTWLEFVVLKGIGDMAEVIMVEELEHCSFLPLQDLAIKIMPEEKFHAGFGRDQMIELVKTPKGRADVQRAVDYIFPVMLPFFGGSDSRNNALFRRWGIKRRTNDEMRAEYVQRVKQLVEGEFGLTVPRGSA
jgi:ring-1,2-phenylacetyl-CoA epoxidase subunit PaaA